MKNSHFSLGFASTLALVLISTILLTACAPQPSTTDTTVPNETTQTSTVDTSSTNETTQNVSLQPRYISPGGEETLTIMLTLADGVVSEAVATSQAKHPTSKQMQAGFVQEFSGAVVGKTLAELENIDRIGGASLTTGAFRAAIREHNQS